MAINTIVSKVWSFCHTLFFLQSQVIEQNEREIEAALKCSEALRQSILKKAFTGQLVPQDPTDETASALLARIHGKNGGNLPSQQLSAPVGRGN